MMKNLIAVAALTAAATLAATGAHAASTEAIANATVQPAGIRTGTSGAAFLNVEGSNNGSFASYGAVRFDLSSVKNQFNSQFGVGGWTISQITLQLTQSNAAFTADGDVGLYFTGNDGVALTSPSSLNYGNFATSFADASPILSYTFHQTSNGAVDAYTLFSQAPGQSAGGNALAADVLGNSLVTLLMRDQSAGVAATYAGFTNNSYAGPTLVIDAVAAAVPEPTTWALMGAGLMAAALLARRRKA